MGLFSNKKKAANRAETRNVFQPFAMSRRLSNIVEENDSDLDNDAGADLKRKNANSNSRNNTPKKKNTPSRRKQRFHRLVEWDYGDVNQPENYQPPKDFLHVQRERENQFFQEGPQKGEMVEIKNAMTLEDAIKASEKKVKGKRKKNQGTGGTLKIFQFAADTASLSKSCSSESSVCSSVASNSGAQRPTVEDMKVSSNDPAAFPLLQSSTTTSSLSKRNPVLPQGTPSRNDSDNDSNVVNTPSDKRPSKIPKLSAPRTSTGTARSLFTHGGASPQVQPKKRPVEQSGRAKFPENNSGNRKASDASPQVQPKKLPAQQSGRAKFPENISRDRKASDAPPQVQPKKLPAERSGHAKLPENISGDRKASDEDFPRPKFLASEGPTSVVESDAFVGFSSETPSSTGQASFGDFGWAVADPQVLPEPQVIVSEKKQDLPTHFELVKHGREAGKKGAVDGFAPVQDESHTSTTGGDFNQEEVDSSKAAYAESQRLIEKSQALINDTKALFRQRNVRIRAEGGSVSPKDDTQRNNVVRWSQNQPKAEVADFQNTDEAPSPFKENENTGPAVFDSKDIFRSKKVKFEKKICSPLMKIPSNDMEPYGRIRITTDVKAAPYEDGVKSQWQTAPGFTIPPKNKEAHRDVSFRFEYENDRSTRKQRDPHQRVKTSDLATRRQEQETSRQQQLNKWGKEATSSQLGAVPMMSPDSMHLFIDKVDSVDDGSINKKGSFASTIDSADSDSTATSVSTFVESSPRGIRGSFPSQMMHSSSSLSMSTASTSIMNDADFFNKASTSSNGGRPPTGIPPTSIFGSMLFQAGDNDTRASQSVSKSVSKSISSNRDSARGVPHDIHALGDAAVSDVTGSTAASEWMIQGNKLLNRYYHNGTGGLNQKKQKLSRQLRKREEQNLQEYQNMMLSIQRDRRLQAQRRPINGFVSDFNQRNDPLDKMRRHQHKFQYPNQNNQSGFVNQEEDDSSTLFEA
ncbi:expressed unknown protein [Seminavis robusta]|uniref:Uncharacterized protein n=1 Tax=Seminavis robusta TaxID=568900 RepID=A0A9N8H201_9STRA|nr:expressed unknown protein [Seminavis robusta]|eukprot:Sro2_g001410.1 n/a (975) ;mRNA; f:142761-145685